MAGKSVPFSWEQRLQPWLAKQGRSSHKNFREARERGRLWSQEDAPRSMEPKIVKVSSPDHRVPQLAHWSQRASDQAWGLEEPYKGQPNRKPRIQQEHVMKQAIYIHHTYYPLLKFHFGHFYIDTFLAVRRLIRDEILVWIYKVLFS